MDKNRDFAHEHGNWASFWNKETRQNANMLRQYKVKFSRAIKLCSNKIQCVYEYWGHLYEEQNDYSNALLKFKRVLAIEPDHLKAKYAVKRCLNYLERHEEALIYIKKDLVLGSGSISCHTDLLKTLKSLNQFKDFEAHYEQIFYFRPDYRTNSEFYSMRAEALVILKEYHLSFESYQKAIEFSLHPTHLHFKYGLALYNAECYQEALDEFEKVVVLDPTNRLAHNNVAFLTYCAGNAHGAIGKLEEIINNNVEMGFTYSLMVLAKSHLQETEEAIQPYIQKLKEIDSFKKESLNNIYNQEIKRTELRLKEDFDEITKDFQLRKLSSIKFVLSLL